ncbi:type IV leader peptidase family protein [mine drainage metagenome]|uniref:Type IV leader peptidase family protein n=1 Tax=mine drainage metagenome TaxID=410659 RepID=A0A1J5S0U0_9ZZZZ
MPSWIASAASLAFVAAVADAALSDLRSLRIPNRDVLILLAAFAAFALARGLSPAECLRHLTAALLLFGLGALLFSLKLWGGGDAKLLAGVGLWTGFSGLPGLVLITALAGGAVALAVLAGRRGKSVPYGIAIAAAALAWWWRALAPLI